MNMSGSPAPFAATPSQVSISSRFGKFFPFLIVLLFSVAAAVAAETLDDQYFRIYGLVTDADSLNAGGKTAPALAKYQQAQSELNALKRANPAWNASVVNFRLNYLKEKIAAMTEPVAAPAPVVRSEARPSAKPAAAADRVKLLNAGAEPRQVLRFLVAPESRETISMSMKMAMTMKMGEAPEQAIKLPEMQFAMENAVKSVSTNGDINYESVIKDVTVAEDPGAMPQVVEAMKKALGGVKGFSCNGVVSSRGISKSLEVHLPSEMDPQMRQQMDQMKDMMANFTTPWPEEAVGPGARWEVKMPIKSQGMTMNQTVTYQLVSLDGDQLAIATTIAQTAANQKIQNPTMPGLKVDLTRMTGSATGNSTHKLARIMPLKGSTSAHTDMTMGMNMGAQKQAMNMKMDIDVQIESK